MTKSELYQLMLLLLRYIGEKTIPHIKQGILVEVIVEIAEQLGEYMTSGETGDKSSF